MCLLMTGGQATTVASVRPLEILSAIAGGLLGALGIDLFGAPGLIVVTVLLILGIALRATVALLGLSIASAVTLALWLLATMHCDPTAGNCTIEGPQLVIFVWLVLVLVVGVAATLRFVARSRTR